MFDAHVPARYRDAGTARRDRRRRRCSSGGTATSRAATSGSTRSPGKPPRDVQRRRDPLRRDAARLLRRPRACARHVGRRPARRAQLPELDRLLRPGAEPGTRPRRQPRDDQGVQRLARRRVVRRVPRPLHPVRDPAALRRRRPRRRGPPPRRQGLPRGHVLARTPRRSACRRSTPTTGTRCSRRRATRARCCAATSGRRPQRRSLVAGRPPPGADDAVVDDVDLHPRRPAVGRLLAPLPRPALLAHRGRHRLDPVLPLAGRAHPRPSHGLDAGTTSPRRQARADDLRRGTSSAASSTTRSGSSCSTSSTSTTCAGSPTTRTPTAPGPKRPRRRQPHCSRRCPTRRSTRSRTRTRCATTSSIRSRPRPEEQCTAGALRAESPDVDAVTRVGRPADERDLESWRRLTSRR